MSRLDHRKRLRENEYAVVDKIFPGPGTHLVVGDSGVGKTTWLLQVLYDWSQGSDILKFQSHPCPWAYVSVDRSTGETDKTLRRLGLSNWDAPIYSYEEVSNINYGFSIDAILGHPMFANVKLFVIEGFHVLIPAPGPRQSQNQADMQYMTHLRQHLNATSRTIIGVTHPPKSKRGENFSSNRSNTLGSQAIGGTVQTMVHVEFRYDEEGQEDQTKRIIQISGRDFPKMYVEYDIDDHGRFINPRPAMTSPKAIIEDSMKGSLNQANLDIWLHSQPVTPLKTEALINAGMSLGMSRATVSRWIDSALERRVLSKLSFGLYQKLIVSPTLPPGLTQ